MSTERGYERTPTDGPGDDAISSDEQTWGVLAHAAAFAGFVIPVLGNVLGPLLVWAIKKDESQFVAENGRRAVNFQITWLILGVGAIAVLYVASLAGFVAVASVFPFLVLAWLVIPFVLVVVAIIRTSDGEVYDYPIAFDIVS